MYYGGRAGGKSFAFADALLTKATSNLKLYGDGASLWGSQGAEKGS